MAAASVTEMIAKRGSTASSKVSATCGGRCRSRCRSPTERSCTSYACATPPPAAPAPRMTPRAREHTARSVMRAVASRRRRHERAAPRPRARARRREDQPMIASSRRPPPPPSELLASIVGAGAVGRLRARPVDDRAVGVRLLDVERVRLGLAPAERGTGRASPRRSGSLPPVHVTFWTTALSPDPVCWTLLRPAGRRHERVDAEAGRHGQHDLRRLQVRPSPSGRRGCTAAAPSRARPAG